MKFSRYNLVLFEKGTDKPILFNTFTGNTFFLSYEALDSIKKNDISSLDCRSRELFSRAGVIIEDTVDELRYFSYFNNRNKYFSEVLSSTIILTWSCNFSCVYCYEGAGEKNETMDHEHALQYIKFMKNEAKSRRSKSMYIVLFGGEPLVNIKEGLFILDELHSYCTQNSISFSCGIITNGTLLNNYVLQQLSKHNCNMVQITLDGMPEAHNSRRPYKNGNPSFNDVIDSIKKVLAYPKINAVIRINIDKTNINDTDTLLKYLGKYGESLTCASIDFGIVRSSTSACSSYAGNCFADSEISDVLEHLWNELQVNGFACTPRPMQRWMFCGLYSDSQFTVTPDCSVYKCWEHAGFEQHRVGTIDSEGNLINKTYAFYDWMTRDPLENHECRECVYLPVCGGGCGSVSYNQSKTYHAPGCFKTKGVVEKQILHFVNEKIKTNVEVKK